MKSQMLLPHAIPLSGRHLIEASAGTGKTHNITRLYIRLLLERSLQVQNMLVMTFTNAATEELRGRIDKELRNACDNWGALGEKDPFYAALEQRFERQAVLPVLRHALLHLDEAAIFTIHGFCARVLGQYAFSSGVSMEVEMEADSSELAMEALRDWYRTIGHDHSYQLLVQKEWHTPERFWERFSRAVRNNSPLLVASEERLLNHWQRHKAEVKQELLSQEAMILSRLVNEHKKRDERLAEWEQLLLWLDSSDFSEPPQSAMTFVNGNRYRGQDDLATLFQPFKDLKKQAVKEAKQAESCEVYEVVHQGVEYVRKAFAVAKERKAVMDYDDLISLLSGRLQSDDGVLLAEQLQHQFPVALVDEFQDTDPQQYAILERLYPKGVESSALCMIGDPKQAIYSFRGGDIFTYLLARDHADHCWHMDTNWRSIDAMVQGYNRLFWGAPLDEEARPVFGFGIDYEQIKSTPKAAANEAPLKDGAVDRGAMNYVWFNPQQQPINAGFRAVIARWCCSEIDRLLTASVSLGERSVQERDIAILVRSAIEAEEMQAALRETGYASVYLSARDNLFAGEEAHELSLVLKGILNCEESRSLIAACSTRLLGGDAERLTALVSEADALVEARYLFMALRNQWHEQGFLPMMMTLVHDHLSPSPVQHERTLTNYLHLAELLQKASGKLHHPQQLLEWLKERIKLNANDQEAELRLESDANLIRIITQHGSKGLEYPVVFVPFSSYPKDPIKRGNSEFEYYEYHDPESYRPLQIIGRDREAQALAREEGFAEAIRLLYVAVTRAEHRCYLCVAPFKESEDSPLARTLGLTESSEWQQQLQNLAATEAVGSRFIEVDEAEVGWVFRRTETVDGDQLKAETFRGEIDRNWRLSSFSALVRNVSHGRLDRREQDELTDATGAEEGATEIRFTLPKGADAGNLLHDVLEHCDFSEPDWSVVLPEPVMRFGRLDAKEEPALIGWLQECLDTELPAIGDRRLSRQSGLMLSQLKWASTLKESSFYFPLEEVCLPTLMEILQQHRGSNAPINLPERHSISGMMHGYIDLIFEQEGRFFVADYKSTHLGNRLTDYNYAALKRNNEEHFYDLQYLIYSLALHRYLSTQKQDYDPERDFGGVYYLYLRGMKPGSDSGVFHTAISPELLQQLDNLFSGEAAA